MFAEGGEYFEAEYCGEGCVDAEGQCGGDVVVGALGDVSGDGDGHDADEGGDGAHHGGVPSCAGAVGDEDDECADGADEPAVGFFNGGEDVAECVGVEEAGGGDAGGCGDGEWQHE